MANKGRIKLNDTMITKAIGNRCGVDFQTVYNVLMATGDEIIYRLLTGQKYVTLKGIGTFKACQWSGTRGAIKGTGPKWKARCNVDPVLSKRLDSVLPADKVQREADIEAARAEFLAGNPRKERTNEPKVL